MGKGKGKGKGKISYGRPMGRGRKIEEKKHSLWLPKVAAEAVLDLRAFDLQRTLEMDEGFLDTSASHEHDATVTSLNPIHTLTL